ncbi:MAG: hypothetical protein HY685_05900, partial [Chloroflexi bacterium]|nr:hypothetical protein [Chloroflexota bacterium]
PAPLDEDKRFLLFETGDARVFFLPDVHTATVSNIAAYYNAALPQIEAYVGVPLPEKTDFYLVRGQERLTEEMRLGGGSEITHVEGISLAGPGYRRAGVYLDVATPESELPLLVVHEAVHQVVARVSRTRPPVWVDEGLADYMGHLVSKEAFPYEAAAWRRGVRAAVRRAVQQDGILLPLATLNESKGWEGGSKEEVTLRYAQAYVAMDYLLERSGLASLRSLFHQVRLGAAGSAAVEAAYGLSLEEVWVGVLASLREPTPEEREAAALADYARATLALLREEGETRRAWTVFARQSTLPRQEREERNLVFLEIYREYQRRLETVLPPEEARTIHDVARRGLKEIAEAMSSFLLYERTGDRSLLADGNERLPRGALWADAASDLLVILLGERRVSAEESL